MYLSTKQHDKLNTIVTSFEVPFRTYISKTLKRHYTDLHSFSLALNAISLPVGVSHTVSSEFGKIKSNPTHYYGLFEATIQASIDKVVLSEIQVPNVATLVAIVEVFTNEFKPLTDIFRSYSTFVFQLEKYHYVRNKLDHRGSKTLSRSDMTPVLGFISDVSVFISLQDDTCFWEKEEEVLNKEIRALESIKIDNPVSIHNFQSIPFTDASIVCREKEIEIIKKFVYGLPNALKKKTSLCLFGYGGVGKTVIVTETIKRIVQDVTDDITVNSYKPYFILFYSAKEGKLDYSITSGDIVEQTITSDFVCFEELKEHIFRDLGISSFGDFKEEGIIVVDNLESLSAEEKVKVKNFIDNMSPHNVQYIITSRNEEEYEERQLISGFDGENGMQFIDDYIQENSIDLSLSEDEKKILIDISRGNTLVLALCLIRLGKHLVSMNELSFELGKSSVSKLSSELKGIPQNGYEIISEFMFKNTFIELEEFFKEYRASFCALLEIFAVYPEGEIDIYTICILMGKKYFEIQPLITCLCKYLIIERKNEKYLLNPFAKKYIVQRLLPDKTKYIDISNRIERSMSDIKKDRQEMEKAMASNPAISNIIDEWFIVYDGDKIAAAKVFKCYKYVREECKKASNWWRESAYDSAVTTVDACKRATIHPYIQFECARIFFIFYNNSVRKEEAEKIIKEAYTECLWLIKTNQFYSQIKSTKTFASVLWLFGSFLYDAGDYPNAIRQLDEAMISFETIGVNDKEYYKCMSRLGWAYYMYYKETKNSYYFTKAESICQQLIREKQKYNDKKIRKIVDSLQVELNNSIK